MYSEIYLRLEPLGLERSATVLRRAGHDLRLIDLQIFRQRDYFRLVDEWRPDAIAFSLTTSPISRRSLISRRRRSSAFPDPSSSQAATAFHSSRRRCWSMPKGAIDCILKGEGEVAAPRGSRRNT